MDLPYSEQEEQTRDIPESVDKFLKTSFGKSLRRESRKAMFHEFPKPNCSAVKVPPADPVLVDFMGSDFPRKRDEQLAKIQSAVTAATSPVCNLWADVLEQGLEDQSTDLIPAEVVLKTCKATVSLLGNAVSYINSQRREKSLPKSCSKLASILQQVSKKRTESGDSELFGETAMSEVSKRVTLLETFRRSAATADPKPPVLKTRFLGKGPATRYGSGLGRQPWYPTAQWQKAPSTSGGKYNFQRNQHLKPNKRPKHPKSGRSGDV